MLDWDNFSFWYIPLRNYISLVLNPKCFNPMVADASNKNTLAIKS